MFIHDLRATRMLAHAANSNFLAPAVYAAACRDAVIPLTQYRAARHIQSMHAVVATVRIEDPGKARAALADLRLDIVPGAPGFVSACWLEPIDFIGMSVIIFDTKEHAEQAATYPLPPLPGVTPLTVEIRQVYASA
jgi:hypothetical protein